MEVQGRSLLAARALSRSRAWPLAGLAVTIAAAALVAAQPVRSPWWTYADADAAYTSAGLDLMAGEHTRYLDHPGLPLEELVAVAFGAGWIGERIGGSHDSAHAFAGRLLLHLDRARYVWRVLAIGIFLVGAALAFLLVGRLLGYGYGLAAGLLWLGSPGLVAMSIQYRPDVALTALSLAVGFLLARAVERRSAGHLAAAAALLGFATTVKMHAAGLLVPLAIAAVWRHPPAGWLPRLREQAGSWMGAHPVALAIGGAAWLAVAVVMNWPRVPFRPTGTQLAVLFGGVGAVAVYSALAWLRPDRVFDPLYAFVAAALAVGLLVPVTLVLNDGLQMLVVIPRGLSGGGVNSGVPLFGTSLHQLLEPPLREALLVFVLGGAAAAVGALRRDPWPVVWWSGALVMGVMAAARLAAPHYFAPAFVLSIPPALWLARRAGPAGAVAAAVVVAIVVVPQIQRRDDAAKEQAAVRRAAAPGLRAAAARLRPGEVALTPSYYPDADTRWFELVQLYVSWSPEYPYRFLPTTARAALYARTHGLRPAYYTGPDASSLRGPTAALGLAGVFRVRPVPGSQDLLRLG